MSSLPFGLCCLSPLPPSPLPRPNLVFPLSGEGGEDITPCRRRHALLTTTSLSTLNSSLVHPSSTRQRSPLLLPVGSASASSLISRHCSASTSSTLGMSSSSSTSTSSSSWFDKAKSAANAAAVATKKAAVYVADQSKQTYDNLKAPPSTSVDDALLTCTGQCRLRYVMRRLGC